MKLYFSTSVLTTGLCFCAAAAMAVSPWLVQIEPKQAEAVTPPDLVQPAAPTPHGQEAPKATDQHRTAESSSDETQPAPTDHSRVLAELEVRERSDAPKSPDGARQPNTLTLDKVFRETRLPGRFSGGGVFTQVSSTGGASGGGGSAGFGTPAGSASAGGGGGSGSGGGGMRALPTDDSEETAAAPEEPAPTTPDFHDADDADDREPFDMSRLVVNINIGHSSSDESLNLIGRRLPNTGWQPFVTSHVQPMIDQGVTRIMLHNPFGARKAVAMQLDQYGEALANPRLFRVTSGFAEAWKPITDQGVEVIAYVGSPSLDADSIEVEAAHGRQAAVDRAITMVQPLLDAGMSVGLDASAITPRNSATFELAEELRRRGVRVYIEARPRAYLPHWFDYPVFIRNAYYHRSNPDRYPELRTRHANDRVLTDEIVRFIQHEGGLDAGVSPTTVRRVLPPIAQSILRDGHTVAIRDNHWFNRGLTLEDFIEAIDAPDAASFD